jgi:hypothetical protein
MPSAEGTRRQIHSPGNFQGWLHRSGYRGYLLDDRIADVRIMPEEQRPMAHPVVDVATTIGIPYAPSARS